MEKVLQKVEGRLRALARAASGGEERVEGTKQRRFAWGTKGSAQK